MSKDIVSIIKSEIFDNIDSTIRIKKQIVINGDAITVQFCDIKWVKVGQTITQFGHDFVIESIDGNTLVVTRLVPNTDLSYIREPVQIKQPVFFHGTHTVTNVEWRQQTNFDVREGTPLIWVRESINESEYKKDDARDFDASPQIFFLDEINSADTNELKREDGVRPMLALADEFLRVVDDSYEIERNSNAPKKTLSRFGNENEKGIYENILDANLGGVEIRPTLTVKKSVRCNC